METTIHTPEIVRQKLETFEQMREEFKRCFQYVQDIHGQRRFAALPVAETVRYLHALWVCERKGRLLSVAGRGLRPGKEYEGERCLQLLRGWQQKQDTASVVDFLSWKLDMLPLAGITRQLQEAHHANSGEGFVRRLEHGRIILLNRGMHFMLALDAIFALPEEELTRQVVEACQQYGHTPEEIERRLEDMSAAIYSYVPHPLLAQQNMNIMNELGIDVIQRPADLPGERSWKILAPVVPEKKLEEPFAEQIVPGYLDLTSTEYNNVMGRRFVR